MASERRVSLGARLSGDKKVSSICPQLIGTLTREETERRGFRGSRPHPPHPDTLGGLISSPGQPQECEEVGGGGEERAPPERQRGRVRARDTQRREEAGKIEVGQGQGEGPAESGGPTLAQPRRAGEARGAGLCCPLAGGRGHGEVRTEQRRRRGQGEAGSESHREQRQEQRRDREDTSRSRHSDRVKGMERDGDRKTKRAEVPETQSDTDTCGLQRQRRSKDSEGHKAQSH